MGLAAVFGLTLSPFFLLLLLLLESADLAVLWS